MRRALVKAKVADKAAAQVEVKQAVIQQVFVGQAAAGPANLEPQVRQFIQQFRPAMRAEYYFIQTVCAPTAEQQAHRPRGGALRRPKTQGRRGADAASCSSATAWPCIPTRGS